LLLAFGAGITSEIGSMTVTQQVDAMRALGTFTDQENRDPTSSCIAYRIPLLVAFANMIGVLGGLIVGVNDLHLDPLFYIQKVFMTVTMNDYFDGFMKAPVFAVFVSITACYLWAECKRWHSRCRKCDDQVGCYFLQFLF